MRERSIRLRPGSCCCCPEGQLEWHHVRRSPKALPHGRRSLAGGRRPATPRGTPRTSPPSADGLDAALEGLRGDVELPIPAASAVKIGGERAYRLHRRGVAVEMPRRRSHVAALDVIAYTDGIATLDYGSARAPTFGRLPMCSGDTASPAANGSRAVHRGRGGSRADRLCRRGTRPDRADAGEAEAELREKARADREAAARRRTDRERGTGAVGP